MTADERGFFTKVGVEAGNYSFVGSSAKAGFAAIAVHFAPAWAECAAKQGFFGLFDPGAQTFFAQL